MFHQNGKMNRSALLFITNKHSYYQSWEIKVVTRKIHWKIESLEK